MANLHPLITQSQLDEIEIMTNMQGNSDQLVIVPQDRLLIVTSTLVSFSRANDLLEYLSEGIKDQQDIDFNEIGIQYAHDDLDPDEDEFEGIKIYNPLGETFIEEKAFDSLMLRFFTTIIESVEKYHQNVKASPWWNKFVENVKKIEERKIT